MIKKPFKYKSTPRFGSYALDYDPITGGLKYEFNYNGLPKFGNYTFYYDPISGSLQYRFKYNRLPRFGSYIFKYKPQDSVIIEGCVIAKSRNRAVLTDVNDKELYTKRLVDVNINNPSVEIQKRYPKESINIDMMDTIYNQRVHNILNDNANIDKRLQMGSKYRTESNPMSEAGQMALRDEVIYSLIYQDTHMVNKAGTDIFLEMPKPLAKKFDSISASIKNDDYMMEVVSRKLYLESERRAKNASRNTYLDNNEGIGKVIDRDISLEKDTKLKGVDRDISLEKEIGIKNIVRNINIEDNYNKRFFANRTSRNIYVKDYEKYSQAKESLVDDSEEVLNSIRNFKNIQHSLPEEMVIKEGLLANSSNMESRLTSDDKESHLNNDVLLDLEGKSIFKDNDLLAIKDGEVVNIEDDILINKELQELQVEDDILINKELQELQVEEDRLLNLHKRFWFLDNVGKKDIKILPNTDSDYPPRIELFDTNPMFSNYIYKYENIYEESNTSEEYRVRLYKTDLNGFYKTHEHIISGMQADYSDKIDEIDIQSTVSNSGDLKYSKRISIEININNIEFDYMIIEQPSNFLGNRFIFVVGEEFLSNNHPIPLGEDMGIFEFPISIAIMVDFINILLLIWSKFYHSYSGCVGVRAIESLVDTVYEWLTLESSIQEDSIEAYNRCYRWFRWECEKVYNKAKTDPELHGNFWIEEVLFEMIDYIEMHHFDKMPEWEDIDRMDEQRNGIFNDYHDDIKFVLDKFKGVRKRVAKKNSV